MEDGEAGLIHSKAAMRDWPGLALLAALAATGQGWWLHAREEQRGQPLVPVSASARLHVGQATLSLNPQAEGLNTHL